MIIDVQKFLIFGASVDIDAFFEKAQKAGFIEFITPARKKLEMTPDMQTILQAIKILKKREHKEPAQRETPLSPLAIAERIVHAYTNMEKLQEERRLTEIEISRILPFGDFSQDDLDFIDKEGKRLLQFFCMNTQKADSVNLPEELIYVGTEYDLDYFVAINRERKSYPGMIEIIIEKPLHVLRSHLELIREEIAKFEKDLKMFSTFYELLQETLVKMMNDYHLEAAKKEVEHPLRPGVFAVQAWIPVTKITAFHGLVGSLAVHFEEIQIEKDEVKPTYMENKGFAKIGEDLVLQYDVPAATDKDPSPWVIWFFALFFAMIIADAGYGLIYLIIALIMKWKLKHLTGAGRRFLKLVFILSFFCIGWGLFTASFFGIEIGPDNPYRKLSPIHYLAQQKAEYHLEVKDDVYQTWVKEYPKVAEAKDGHEFLTTIKETREGKVKFLAMTEFYDNILMELSLLVGMIHIILAFAKQILRNWAGFGWILFIIGGYLFFPSIVNATTLINVLGIVSKPVAFKIGEQLLYGGIGLAILAAFIQKRWGFAHEIMNVVQIFADILSYLRLYALALASMIVADTFNAIGLSIGLVVGIVIIIFGQGVNLLLATMGGVIHGLRLNFLEWYHYCFEGGGKLFNPLRLIKKI